MLGLLGVLYVLAIGVGIILVPLLTRNPVLTFLLMSAGVVLIFIVPIFWFYWSELFSRLRDWLFRHLFSDYADLLRHQVDDIIRLEEEKQECRRRGRLMSQKEQTAGSTSKTEWKEAQK